MLLLLILLNMLLPLSLPVPGLETVSTTLVKEFLADSEHKERHVKEGEQPVADS